MILDFPISFGDVSFMFLATLLAPGRELYFYLLCIQAELGPWLDMW